MKARPALLAGATVIAALVLVFTAYRQPDMVLTLATQLWSCF